MNDLADDDDGFTLVELVLAVAILGVLVVALTGALIVGLRTMDRTSNRYAASNDAQLLARYLPPDIQSANSGSASSLSACSGTSNRRLELVSEPDGFGTGARTIMYWVRATDAGEHELVRSVWENGVACTSGPAGRSTVVSGHIAGPADVTTAQLPNPPLGFAMTVTEAPARNEPNGYRFTVTGRSRTTS